jgi:hypothetical protein
VEFRSAVNRDSLLEVNAIHGNAKGGVDEKAIGLHGNIMFDGFFRSGNVSCRTR